jgi:hypothetical protein
MIRRFLAALAGVVAISGACGAFAEAPLPPNDYADQANWLCWPGAAVNACDVDLTTTVVKADGTTSIETFKPNPKAPIDCFYVYPTVSTDPGVLSTMAAEAAETRVVEQQFARFGASCRLYAPLYRQFTLTALAAAMSGHPLPGSTPRPTTPYSDIRDAWTYYLAYRNHGRGVVLIGHSQGSGVLTELIKNEIDGKPAQAQLVSAILMGTNLAVPKDGSLGGDLQNIPQCRSPSQTGCVIAYASFRDNSPPPDNSRFGRPRVAAPGMIAACVNPANLAGGGGELHSYLASGSAMIAPSSLPPPVWVKGKTISTPFVSVPGLLAASCVRTPMFHYLAIHVNADPASPRASDIPGDIILGGQVLKDWGLHLIDANLAMGDLVKIVGEEGKAWTAAH